MLTIKHKAEFSRLANLLSPENLSNDGELSVFETQLRHTNIMYEWARLELRAGQMVSIRQANTFYREVEAHNRSKPNQF